ncbi:MAG: ROK family protein [Actinomycetota bacterium]|nr:ROK family protein [Actinomycetota bacterium]
MSGEILGIDIGGTHFRMGLCSADGELLKHEMLATDTLESPSDGLKRLVKAVDPHGRAERAAAGVPGIVDYEAQSLLYAPNLPKGFPQGLSAAAIGEAIGTETVLVNDADLAAIGEAYLGAGAGRESMAYVTISTGVGAGVVIGGRLLRSRYSIAELGHSYIEAKLAERSGAGSVEAEASGTALGRRAASLGIEGGGAALVRKASAGDAQAMAEMAAFANYAAVALVNMVQLFSVELVVVGGGVILGGGVTESIATRLSELTPDYFSVELRQAALGDDAALRGASQAHLALAGSSPQR